MDPSSVQSILYGNIEIPTSHVSPYAVDESVLLYEPLPEDIINNGNRNIFNNVFITPDEESMLEGFIKYICNDYLVKADSNVKDSFQWLYLMEPEFLRFLYFGGFDYKKTLECVMLNYQFRKSNMLPAVLDDIEDELNDGYMYWFGRDRKCRPTLVADVFKLQNLSMEKLVKLVVFCFEFFLRYLHVGGRSENYNVLIDCENRGVVQLPVQMIIQLTEIMHSKYRGRLNNLILVNSPNLINVILKPLKGVLPDRLFKKIVIFNQDSREELMLLYNPNQLQQRFGGDFPDLTSNYYPFQFFPNFSDNVKDDNTTKVDKENKEDNNNKDNNNLNHLDQGDWLVKNYSILKIPPSVLYGRCMIVNKCLSEYLCKIINPNLHSGELIVDNNTTTGTGIRSDSGDKVNNTGNNNTKEWFKNIRYYMLSSETGKYLINKLPGLKDEIEFSTIRDRRDLVRFIKNLDCN